MAGTGRLEGSTACRRPARPRKSRPVWTSVTDLIFHNCIETFDVYFVITDDEKNLLTHEKNTILEKSD